MPSIIPKKSLGQHWLYDVPILQGICEAGDVNENDVIVEVGPGLGTLTEHLVKRAKKIIAVEFDHELAVRLSKQYKDSNIVTVVESDILSFDLTTLPSDYKVIANIPYYLTSNLLRVFSEANNPPKTMVILVQKEVAQRVCAQAGDMSLLSVSVQYYYAANLGEIVPARLFTPPPKVDSQVIILHRHEQPLFQNVDSRQFFRLVKAGFANRRKTLSNSLAAGLRITKAEVNSMLDIANINPSTRPQELSIEQWYKIYKVINT